MKMTEM